MKKLIFFLILIDNLDFFKNYFALLKSSVSNKI